MRSGTPIFHQVAALFVLASLRDAEEVDRGEERHQHDGGDDSAGGEDVLAVLSFIQPLRERVMLAVAG